MLLDLKNMLIAGAAGLLLGAIISGIATQNYVDNKWNALVALQKEAAARILQDETEKVLKTERINNELNNRLEVTHAEAQDTIDRTLADNRRLAQQLGGLRDPGRRQSCSRAPAGNNPAANPAASAAESRLSAEANEFLLTLAADADRAAEYALTCHAWAKEMADLSKNKKNEVSP